MIEENNEDYGACLLMEELKFDKSRSITGKNVAIMICTDYIWTFGIIPIGVIFIHYFDHDIHAESASTFTV